MRKRRPGYTLIEMVTFFTLVSVVMGVATMVLHGLYRADHDIRDEVMQRRQLTRLAEQFRSDVHVATAASIEPAPAETEGPPELLLTLPDGRNARYQRSEQGLQRLLREGETVLHRESFRLPRLLGLDWQQNSELETPLVSLVLDLQRDSRVGASTRLRIDSALGMFGATE